MPQRSIADGH
ncbi:unnamed protein product, partial [Rotaria sp. Silwood1]